MSHATDGAAVKKLVGGNLPGANASRPAIAMADADLDETDIQAVLDVLRSKRLALGPKTEEFERSVAQYCSAKHAIAVCSGTAALHLICRAIGLGRGDEEITTPFSFVASTNCFLYENATPVFVDIEPETYAIDPERIEAAITPRTKAIVAVDVFGHPADWDPILAIAEKHGLEVIADSCESLGSSYKGRKTGPFGAGGAFAYYPNKQMTTGEGGMIVTNRDDVATLCRSMANQGRNEMGAWLDHPRLGFNYRMDEMSAALGVTQIRRIDQFAAHRAAVAAKYDSLFMGEPRVKIPRIRDWATMNYFVYVVELANGYDRDDVMRRLSERGVPTRGYFSPIHTQPYIREMFGGNPPSFPVTEAIAKRTLALPFHNHLPAEHAEFVVRNLREVLDEAAAVQPQRRAA